MARDPDVRPAEDPEGRLETAFIDEFLRTHGHDARSIEALPEDARGQLLREASIYATSKLAEVEARAHYVHELHHQE